MTDILSAIQEKLGAVASIKHVDENWGQLTNFGANCPVQWPCALIDVRSGKFSDVGRDRHKTPTNRQQGDITVEIEFANLKLSNTSRKATDGQKAAAWTLWGLVEQAHAVLHGWRPTENSGALMRVDFRKIKREDGVQLYQVVYSVGVNEV